MGLEISVFPRVNRTNGCPSQEVDRFIEKLFFSGYLLASLIAFNENRVCDMLCFAILLLIKLLKE